MRNHYLIADHIVRVGDDTLSDLLTGFECDSECISTPDPCGQESICSITRTATPPSHGVEIVDHDFPVSHVLTLTRESSAVLVADDTFERISVRGRRKEGLSDLMLLAIYSRLTYFQTIFVHGALVDVPGYGGIMFTGRSNVGKTTQAILWEQYEGAEIINGDKVFLSVKPEYPSEIFAYGSPWRGSSPYCVNKRIRLRAIIDLVREEEKYIRPLRELEALVAYMPSVFMPNWDARLTEKVMETVDLMLPRVPIYQMSCDKDRSAVDMAKAALFPD